MKLFEETFCIETPDGKSHKVADPLQLMIDLEADSKNINDDTGSIKSDVVDRLRAKIKSACGVDGLTVSQVMQVVAGLGAYANEVQKKIASTLTSSPSTDATRRTPASASPST